MDHRFTAGSTLVLLMLLTADGPGFAADHLDAPALNPLRLDADINDLYLFTRADPNTTVLAATFSPAAGAIGPDTFATDVIYQLNIVDLPGASQFDVTASFAYRATFGLPDAAGIQIFSLYRATGGAADGHSVNPANLIFSGFTGRNHDLPGGGQLFAGLRSDPFFFDLAAFQGSFGEQNNGRGFNDGNEVDFFEDLNVLALVLEIPDSQLPSQTSSANTSFAVWASTGNLSNGVQLDRKGRPAVNTVVNSTGSLIGAPSANKNTFNGFHPSSDAAFQQAVKDALAALSALDSEGPYNSTELNTLADILLPDVLPFSKNDGVLGPPLNGRRLKDDVIDIELNLLTGGDPLGLFSGRDATGGIRGDGVGPHDDYLSVFPYLATPLGPPATNGGWTDVSLFGQQPLEAKLGTLSDGLNTTAQGFIIWDNGPDNVLTGITIPPPYDGTGVTTQAIDVHPVLFSLGDVCTDGTDAVVPYIRNFKPFVARYDSSGSGVPTVTTQPLNVPPTVPYDSADCGVTQDGFFISTHNDNNNEIELYRSANGGQSYTFYGRYPDSVSGPFGAGALRDQLVTHRNGSQAAGLYQRPDGAVRVTTFSTNQNPPVFSTNTVLSGSPPPGFFVFVKESGATAVSRLGATPSFYFTYNFDGNARVTEIPVSDPSTQTNRNLGAVNNSGGSDYTFSGGTIVGQPTQTNVIWGDWFLIDDVGSFAGVDPEYPNIGVGGPVDGCFVKDPVKPGFTGSYYLTGRSDTRLLRRDDFAAEIFTDGFESGDTSSWRCD